MTNATQHTLTSPAQHTAQLTPTDTSQYTDIATGAGAAQLLPATPEAFYALADAYKAHTARSIAQLSTDINAANTAAQEVHNRHSEGQAALRALPSKAIALFQAVDAPTRPLQIKIDAAINTAIAQLRTKVFTVQSAIALATFLFDTGCDVVERSRKCGDGVRALIARYKADKDALYSEWVAQGLEQIKPCLEVVAAVSVWVSTDGFAIALPLVEKAQRTIAVAGSIVRKISTGSVIMLCNSISFSALAISSGVGAVRWALAQVNAFVEQHLLGE